MTAKFNFTDKRRQNILIIDSEEQNLYYMNILTPGVFILSPIVLIDAENTEQVVAW